MPSRTRRLRQAGCSTRNRTKNSSPTGTARWAAGARPCHAKRRLDPDDFWSAGPRQFGDAIGTDLRIGRKAYGILRRLGLSDITVNYVVVDPLRVPRETFAAIWRAWRDGYADAVSANTSISREMFLAQFDDMVDTLEAPSGYGVWHVPVIAGRVP